MKRQILIFISILSINSVFAQELIEKTYLNVIKEVSTAPDFVVIKIKNKKTNSVKEICTDVTSLYLSLKLEYQSDFNLVYDILVTKSKNRVIEIENSKALEIINFNKYNAKKLDKIIALINKKSLIDSLKQFDKYRQLLSDKYYPYKKLRIEKIRLIRDSISINRELTTEEGEILNKLYDPYYDYHYNDWYWDKLTDKGKTLIKKWNVIIKKDKEKIEFIEKERDRREKKFFFDYYNKYGILFCHALFNFGMTCYQDCENGQIKFGQLITMDE